MKRLRPVRLLRKLSGRAKSNLIQLFRELSGRANADLIQLLLQQIEASLAGAWMAREAACSEHPPEVARKEIGEIEHAGDQARERLVTTLARSLVTPFDREDLFRVSRSIDDVLDNLRDFVRELDLFQAPDDLFAPLIDAVIESLELLHQALEGVTTAPKEVHVRTLAAKKSGNDIRRTYDEQMARLLEGKVTAAMLRRRELLRRLDVVGLRLGEAVDALADATIKRTM